MFCLDEFSFFPMKQIVKSYQSRCQSEVPLCGSHISIPLTSLLQYEMSMCCFPCAMRRMNMHSHDTIDLIRSIIPCKRYISTTFQPYNYLDSL